MPGIVWLIAAVLALADQVHAGATARLETAHVYSARSAELLYREVHWLSAGPTPERWVLYTCPNGKPFARKHVRTSGAQPDFELEDGRDGYIEGVRSDGGARYVYVRSAGAESRRRIEVPADGVIDAGFDAAVRAHWHELMRGRSIRLQFLIPSRKRFYPMRLQHVGSLEWHGIAAERLRMRLDSWLAFSVPDVFLIYARHEQRLLEFSGTGNVRDEYGRNPQVRIAFAPQPDAIDAAAMNGIDQLPLAASCRN